MLETNMFLQKELEQLIPNLNKIPDEFWVKSENGKQVIWILDREDGKAGDYETSQERLGLTKEGEIIYGFSSGCSCWSGWESGDYCPTLSYKEFGLKKIHSYKGTEGYYARGDEAVKSADISFAEGWEKESQNNLQDFLALVDENPPAEKVLKIQNAEIRRYLIKRVGYEKIKKDVNAKLIDDDGTSQLLEFEGGERYVKVKDSSTEREYLLYVPNNITNCKAGIAWTFGLTAGEYHPAIET